MGSETTNPALLRIKLEGGAPLPSLISVDGAEFCLAGQRDGSLRYRRLGDDGHKRRPSPLFISVPASDQLLEGFLPYELCVNWGRKYNRRFDGFYTPTSMRPKEVEQFFDLIASSYEAIAKTELNEQVYKLLFERLDAALPRTSRPVRILDFGVGTGYSWDIAKTVFKRRQLEFFGVDLSLGMVEVSRARGLKNTWKCSYDRIPFHSGTFDGVVACYVVHYLHDPAVQLREMSRVLRPGGVLGFNLHKPLMGYEADYVEKVRQRRIPLEDLAFTSKKVRVWGEDHLVHLVIATRPLRPEKAAEALPGLS